MRLGRWHWKLTNTKPKKITRYTVHVISNYIFTVLSITPTCYISSPKVRHSPSQENCALLILFVDLARLPSELELLTIYTDFMSYILQHTGDCISQVFGADIWNELKDDVEIVMTYPNLWKTEQKQVLLNAAILSGWITEPRCRTNLFFVEEAQAAARYCAAHPDADFKGFMVSAAVLLFRSAAQLMETLSVRQTIGSPCVTPVDRRSI